MTFLCVSTTQFQFLNVLSLIVEAMRAKNKPPTLWVKGSAEYLPLKKCKPSRVRIQVPPSMSVEPPGVLAIPNVPHPRPVSMFATGHRVGLAPESCVAKVLESLYK